MRLVVYKPLPQATKTKNLHFALSLRHRIIAVNYIGIRDRHYHSVISLCSLSPRHLCALCLGHLCALPLGIVAHTSFALSAVAHFALDIVAHFALGRCALCFGSLSPFARSPVTTHVLVANWCGLCPPNTEPVLRRPMACSYVCRVLSLTLAQE